LAGTMMHIQINKLIYAEYSDRHVSLNMIVACSTVIDMYH